MIRIRNLAAAAVLAVATLPAASFAQPITSSAAEISFDKLKQVYLECERSAVGRRLASGEIALCSIIYEDLKQNVFGGDFKRLKTWADAHLRPQTH